MSDSKESGDSMITEAQLATLPTTISILTIISVIGSIGNTFVIYVYSHKNDKQTSTLFILILACADCINCLVIVPYTILIEAHLWRFPLVICQSYYMLNTSGITFSSLLMSAIAVDRYLCICQPFLRIMTVSRAKIVICCLAVFAIIMGIMSTFQMTSTTIYISNDNITNVAAPQCIEVTYNNETSNYKRIFYQVVQKNQLFDLFICILSVIILYILIFRSVLKVRRKKAELKGIALRKPDSPKGQDKQNFGTELSNMEAIVSKPLLQPANTDSNHLKHTSNSNGEIASQQILTEQNLPEDTFPNQQQSDSDKFALNHQSAKHHRENFFQNLKLASMLFVVALVYIICFLPATMMANGWLTLYLPVFYLYYFNSAADPIIYCFMNPNFRNDISQIFCQNRRL